MPHDPELVAEVREWFARAEEDLDIARRALADPPRPSSAAYHAQQAAEKAIKGFLAWHGIPFGKTHNLVDIGEECAKIDSSLDPSLRRAARLSAYAWRTRYPDSPKYPDAEEAEAAISIASALYEETLSRLPSDVRP